MLCQESEPSGCEGTTDPAACWLALLRQGQRLPPLSFLHGVYASPLAVPRLPPKNSSRLCFIPSTIRDHLHTTRPLRGRPACVRDRWLTRRVAQWGSLMVAMWKVEYLTNETDCTIMRW
jgi:hypothetical protein